MLVFKLHQFYSRTDGIIRRVGIHVSQNLLPYVFAFLNERLQCFACLFLRYGQFSAYCPRLHLLFIQRIDVFKRGGYDLRSQF